MASTRNKNSPGDYKLEKKAIIEQGLYPTYINSSYGIAQTTYFPGDGLCGAKVPTTELSENWCDIETQLFGIGSNNLENPKSIVVPEFKNLKSLNVIDKIPILIPKPLTTNTSERPMFLN